MLPSNVYAMVAFTPEPKSSVGVLPNCPAMASEERRNTNPGGKTQACVVLLQYGGAPVNGDAGGTNDVHGTSHKGESTELGFQGPSGLCGAVKLGAGGATFKPQYRPVSQKVARPTKPC